MKFKILALATFCSMSVSAVIAAPVVQFVGEVSDQTCKASINSQADSTVMLATASVADLSTAGKTSTVTPFTLKVEDCALDKADVAIKTTFLGYDVTSNGNLGNQETGTNAATGVSIQITKNADGTSPITLNGPTSVPGLVLKAGQTSASYDFAAQYYAEAPATAGVVKATAEYALSYN
jgi:major type 1 subunit fimbrin (pilin)